MKEMRTGLSVRYTAMLRAHLHRKNPNGARPAQGLGRAAAAAGLSTLDLARMHERAVKTLSVTQDFPRPPNGSMARAEQFFTQALLPLEADQRAVRENNRHLRQRNETLRRHTAALARGNRRLEREITRREAGEVKIEQAKERYRRLFLESQVMQDKLRQLTRQIIFAQEEERKAISRELHDEVVQTLVGINVALSALGQDVDEFSALRKKIGHTQRLVEHSVSAVHRFARELRPAVLDDLGLIPALHAYSQKLAERKRLRIHLTAFAGVEALTIARRTVLFRVAQEALTNVARHAEATHVTLGISEQAGAIRMAISDNGKSFQVGKTLLARNPKRLGLIGMRERIEMIGGRLTIESSPARGTTVCAEIPFRSERKTK